MKIRDENRQLDQLAQVVEVWYFMANKRGTKEYENGKKFLRIVKQLKNSCTFTVNK